MSTIRPAKLPESYERLGDSLFAAFQCGIILVDGQDRLSVVTEAATRVLSLTGPRSQRLDGLPATLQTLIDEVRSSGQPLVDRSIHFEDSNRALSLRVSAFPMGSDKTALPVAIVLQNQSADQKLGKHLQQLDRLATFGTLSAGIAHEIKNALVVGKTFFDLLLEKHQEAELVQLVRQELTRIDSLVTQMLRFTSPAKPALADIQVHEVLEHSLLMVKRQIEDKSIQLKQLYAAPSDSMRGDKFQLEQAFVNLLLNAIEAMGPRGRLTVATGAGASEPNETLLSKGRGHMQVRIEDSGIGIPPENIGRLFGPFFTTKSGGTGLGLSITRRIIEEHGGQISVKSKPNEGTCFQILLPVLDRG